MSYRVLILVIEPGTEHERGVRFHAIRFYCFYAIVVGFIFVCGKGLAIQGTGAVLC